MESLEELKAIIDNAPEGATIVDIESDGFIDYLYCDTNAPSGEKIKSYSNVDDSAIEYSSGNIRSLSDIERIIELMELNQKANQRRKECKHADMITNWDHNQCKSCGYIRTDSGFGCASNKWFPNIEAAKFYEKNGFLPEGV